MGVWDRFLSAMKLNDDDGFDDDEFLNEEIDDYEDQAPRRNFFQKRKEENYDDYDYEEDDAPKGGKSSQRSASSKTRSSTSPKAGTSSSKIAPMRTKKSGSGMEVCVIKPRSMEDAREVTETLLSNCTVVLNMEGLNLDTAQRIIDFSSGTCFAINGSLQKISNFIFLVTPSDVDISGDFQDLINGSIDMSSLGDRF